MGPRVNGVGQLLLGGDPVEQGGLLAQLGRLGLLVPVAGAAAAEAGGVGGGRGVGVGAVAVAAAVGEVVERGERVGGAVGLAGRGGGLGRVRRAAPEWRRIELGPAWVVTEVAKEKECHLSVS